MRIGIMLRHLRQHGGGVRVYTENLLRELLNVDTPHEFVLLYADSRLVGTYANDGHVREVAVSAPSTILWDQVAVPLAARREQVDIIFNPKYSVPLISGSRTAFVCHGLDWFVNPQWSKPIDRLSHRYLIPRYAKSAELIIAVSDTARKHVVQYLGVEENRVRKVYLGVDDAFRDPVSEKTLEQTRRLHGLPEKYFLYCGQIYPPKNFGRLLQAYARVGPDLGISLVVAGEHRWLCEEELSLIETLNLRTWVVQTGWVGREHLPAFYAGSCALLLPSLYEACPSPILEAMASGCPVVTSNRYGTGELAGSAAVLINPEDVESIVDGIRRIATDEALRDELVKAGRQRVEAFSWQRCGEQTLVALEEACGG